MLKLVCVEYRRDPYNIIFSPVSLRSDRKNTVSESFFGMLFQLSTPSVYLCNLNIVKGLNHLNLFVLYQSIVINHRNFINVYFLINNWVFTEQQWLYDRHNFFVRTILASASSLRFSTFLKRIIRSSTTPWVQMTKSWFFCYVVVKRKFNIVSKKPMYLVFQRWILNMSNCSLSWIDSR